MIYRVDVSIYGEPDLECFEMLNPSSAYIHEGCWTVNDCRDACGDDRFETTIIIPLSRIEEIAVYPIGDADAE